MNKTLWSKNFTIIIVATMFGAIGNIAGEFALSFLVFEKTQSTFAAAILLAIRVIPSIIIPIFISPIMDKMPRKPFLVFGDFISGILYLIAGVWLLYSKFEYIYYLLFSLILASIRSVDELSYNSIYPKLIPEGMEEKGYSVSSMLYPTLMIIMMPLSAILYKAIGVANIIIIQGFLCVVASIVENNIDIVETVSKDIKFSFSQWKNDLLEAINYIKNEKGILAMTINTSVSGGMHTGYESILVAFFSSVSGFTMAMYSFFTVANFIGRSIGGILMYNYKLKNENKYSHALFVYLFYDVMDVILLWLSYPLMLINRGICGFLGIQSGTLRHAAIQKYIPDNMRARVNTFQAIVFLVFSSILSLFIGYLGEVLDYKMAMSIGGIICIIVCIFSIVLNKKDVSKIYLSK